MENKNGFTLVELLGVIVILAVISAITIPTVTGIIKNNKEKAYDQNVNTIISAAKTWSEANSSLISSKKDNYVFLDNLINSGFISQDKIVNPKTNTDMTGCVKIKYSKDFNQYEYDYNDLVSDCPQRFYQIIIDSFPYLEVGTNGCKTPGDNNYNYMGGCYLTGNINNNYLWYSGILWRIMGINADKSIKIISEDSVSVIPYNKTSPSFSGSYVEKYLNSYFNNNFKGNNLVKNSNWCDRDSSEYVSDPANAKRTTCTTTVQDKYGLISIDEYNLAGGSSSYLYNNQSFFTLTPYDNSNVVIVFYNGINIDKTSFREPFEIRPVINIDSTNAIISNGNGLINSEWNNEHSPYILDSQNVESDYLSNNATSGDYVRFADKNYRVVSVDSEGQVKLVLDGYYEKDGTNVQEVFGDSYNYILSSGIGQTLNTEVYDWLIPSSDDENRDKIVTNYNWFQNIVSWGFDYHTSLDDSHPINTVSAPVGLLNIGELQNVATYTMTTKNLTSSPSYNNISDFWTITPYPETRSLNWFINHSGHAFARESANTASIRPSIVIKSNVKIKNGYGNFSNPYEI